MATIEVADVIIKGAVRSVYPAKDGLGRYARIMGAAGELNIFVPTEADPQGLAAHAGASVEMDLVIADRGKFTTITASEVRRNGAATK